MCLFANLKSIGLAYESIVLVDVSEYCMKWSMWRTGDIPFHLFLCLFIFLKEVHTTPQTIVPSQSDVVYSWTTKWIVVRVGWGIGKRRYEYKSKYSLGIDLTDCTKSMICCFTVNCMPPKDINHLALPLTDSVTSRIAIPTDAITNNKLWRVDVLDGGDYSARAIAVNARRSSTISDLGTNTNGRIRQPGRRGVDSSDPVLSKLTVRLIGEFSSDLMYFRADFFTSSLRDMARWSVMAAE